MSEHGQIALLERGAAVDYPAIPRAGGMGVLIEPGKLAWEYTMSRLSVAELRELSHALDLRAERADRERDAEEKRARRDAPPDESLAAQARIEAEAARQEHERRRPERVEQLLERIASAVEGMARR